MMKIITRLKNEYIMYKLWKNSQRYYRRGSRGGGISKRPAGDFCDLATVSFNNAKLVSYQIRTLQKFFSYPFRYTVFDNSTDDETSDEIYRLCSLHNVGYVRLPEQDFIPAGYGSYSHGIACNYLFYNYIQGGGSKYFGLLDHDIFPIEKFDINGYLEKQEFYGIKHGRYLWPGFFFVRMSHIENIKLDFRPSLWLHGDTGACNRYRLFRHVDFSKYETPSDEHRLFGNSKDIFEDGYSYFSCGWIHCWNASNYMGKDMHDKMRRIFLLLEEALNR